MKRVIIVGYKSFLQENLYKYLKKKKINVRKIKFSSFKNIKLHQNDTIINCSITDDFFYKKYKTKNDRNLEICKLIKNQSIKFIMFSTRQIYKPKLQTNEKSKIKPINNYAQNYYMSEINCKKIMKNNILILRISNVIGYDSTKKKRLSMLRTMIEGIKKKIIIFDNSYKFKKDILPVNFFSVFVYRILIKNVNGILNIGSGQSFTLLQIAKIFIRNKKYINIQINNKNKSKDESYSYNVSRLHKITKVKYSRKDVIKEIQLIRFKFFEYLKKNI